jgi:hypothetical protein
MGLDMYAYSVSQDNVIDDFSFKRSAVDSEVNELFYWRKHPNLHGFIENIWRDRGAPSDDVFNCKPIRLHILDIRQIEHAVENELLPVTEGFFFGQSTSEQKSEDLEFCALAKIEIEKGRAVYYDSWW